jgi:hypothetical protein
MNADADADADADVIVVGAGIADLCRITQAQERPVVPG